MPTLKTLLTLGRVSNLSTVWSNVLCAWLIAGGSDPARLLATCFGASSLYLGGMFLNDFFDADFDARHRPERPIPSGAITRRLTFRIACGLLVVGIASVAWMNWQIAAVAGVLSILIFAYNAVHKTAPLAGPVLMAACRAGLYPLAAMAVGEPNLAIGGAALAMFGYIAGVTLLARSEGLGDRISGPALAITLAPLLALAAIPARSDFSMHIATVSIAAAWIALALGRTRVGGSFVAGRAIGPLLAGIPFIDLLVLSSLGLINASAAAPFLAFFAIALLAQRAIPAS